MSASNLLYEPPGPIARRRNRIISVIGVVLLVCCALAAGHRLDASGQFDANRWQIFLHPGTIRFLFDGLMATLLAAAISTVLAFSLALPLALARLSNRFWLRTLAAAYIGCFRAVPLLLLILFTVILLPSMGLNWHALGYLVFGMVLHHSAMTAEVVRAGILSLGRGQREAALSIGMREHQAMIWVVLPQALKLMLPALISSVLAIVQDTSLGYIIPYEELLRRSQQISSFAPQSLLQSAFIVTVMYGFVSALLLALRRWIERRQAYTSRAVVREEGVEANLGGVPGMPTALGPVADPVARRQPSTL
ncbi:amino acid ABC transporter permease [Pseudomonas sp. KK4]|uniref:amino acid ABC transporter permease n=1 Tax=Pseudomonas sp. KK4 TaxID=1855729 RepID=UPI00097C15BE|nr:amino acid ABC transporter permease [Pseudomonas sp. KK4]